MVILMFFEEITVHLVLKQTLGPSSGNKEMTTVNGN